MEDLEMTEDERRYHEYIEDLCDEIRLQTKLDKIEKEKKNV